MGNRTTVKMRKYPLRRCACALLLLLPLHLGFPTTAFALSNPKPSVPPPTSQTRNPKVATDAPSSIRSDEDETFGSSRSPHTHSFSVPLVEARPEPDNIFAAFEELWNDPRSVGSAIKSRTRSGSSDDGEEDGPSAASTPATVPYCIVSDEFDVGSEQFRILLYPRGRFAGGGSSGDVGGSDAGVVSGPASAYLRYVPKESGDECDVSWTLRLVDGTTGEALSVGTSGGLPRSADAWSSGMTFCAENEAIESAGRASDWGASTWSAVDVCSALLSAGKDGAPLRAEGEVTLFDARREEKSLGFAWPPFSRGAIGAVRKSALDAAQSGERGRDFRVGEVIVPTKLNGKIDLANELQRSFVYPGIDYRIMTMTDGDGNPIFSTADLPEEERSRARLALRPCGWKLQQQVWKKNGMTNEWPVEVESGKLSRVTLTRFNPGSTVPRLTSALTRDFATYALALTVAIMPIPLALLARNAASFYVIPSASMEPTLLKGDVLLVEKFPGVYDRTQRGDVVLFRPPSALRDIVLSSGSQLSSTSLFVKRVVGLPGDRRIELVADNEITVNGNPAVGPDRTLCADEPLRLIDRLLKDGKGKDIDELGSDEVYVLGDCKAVSVDSRVFGTLRASDIVGKPIARIWPLNRFEISDNF